VALRECPSCGGSGGGPFGRAGSAWDQDNYVCPRCEGRGHVVEAEPKPGVAKATQAEEALKKKRAG
jgi:DnaJ-class molecular chaperone